MSNLLKPAKGAVKKRIRKGRGNASGKGGECGRGHKGQKSRSGYSAKPGFEGGQMPLYKRIPKRRGFTNNFKKQYSIVNLFMLDKFFSDSDQVSPDILVEKGLAVDGAEVKLLAKGDLNKKLSIQVHAASAAAVEKLKNSDASLELISTK